MHFCTISIFFEHWRQAGGSIYVHFSISHKRRGENASFQCQGGHDRKILKLVQNSSELELRYVACIPYLCTLLNNKRRRFIHILTFVVSDDVIFDLERSPQRVDILLRGQEKERIKGGGGGVERKPHANSPLSFSSPGFPPFPLLYILRILPLVPSGKRRRGRGEQCTE